MLADNNIPPYEDVRYPMLWSCKRDGIRCLVIDGELLTRTMKPQVNRNLPRFLRHVIARSRREGIVWDGELYDHTKPFNWHQSTFRSHHAEIPDTSHFDLIDAMPRELWFDKELCAATPFQSRVAWLEELARKTERVLHIPQVWVHTPERAKELTDEAIADHYEGGMLRDPLQGYRHGRTSVGQNWLIKLKDWIVYDAVVIDVLEGECLRTGAEEREAPTGGMERSHRKADYMPSGMMGSLLVRLDDGTETGIGTWRGLTHDLRRELLANKDQYIGQWVRFRGQRAGVKDRPRIPKDLEWRDPK